MSEAVKAACEAGKIDPQAFVAQMRAESERLLQEVAEAVNAAPDGAWIEGSEVAVFKAMAAFQHRTFQQAVQMRTDAHEASFSPSGR